MNGAIQQDRFIENTSSRDAIPAVSLQVLSTRLKIIASRGGGYFCTALYPDIAGWSMLFAMSMRFSTRLLIFAATLFAVAAVPFYVFSDSDEPSSILIEKLVEDAQDDDERENLVVLPAGSNVRKILHASSLRDHSTCSPVLLVCGPINGRGPPIA